MSLKKSKHLIFFALIFSVLLLLVVIKKTVTQKPLTRDDFEPETYTVIEESTDYVSNFPELPHYPESEIVNSKYYTEEGGEGYSLELSTEDSILNIIEWYMEKLDEDGWYIIYETEMTENPDYFLIEYKKPNIQLDVSAVRLEDGSTRVIITHHENMGEYGPSVKYE